MLGNKRIGVVVACYNERAQIPAVLAAMPKFVDRIWVVDDASTDGSDAVVQALARGDGRIRLERHAANSGIGTVIGTGYRLCVEERLDIAVVVAGDGQMDLAEMSLLVEPVAAGLVDYCKGNRFIYPLGIGKIPWIRLVGNFALSAMTKISAGYWHVSDSQCGYTAISRRAMEHIDCAAIYPSYGCPNDILTKLNIAGMRVGEVPVRPLYGIGERSKMRVARVALPILCLLTRNFFHRIFQKYVFRSGHPLVLAYFFGLISLGLGTAIWGYIAYVTLTTGVIPKAALMTGGVMVIMGLQFLLSAFEMDFNDNRALQIRLEGRIPPTGGD